MSKQIKIRVGIEKIGTITTKYFRKCVRYQPVLQKVPWLQDQSSCGASRNWVSVLVGPDCVSPTPPRNLQLRRVLPMRGKQCVIV